MGRSTSTKPSGRAPGELALIERIRQRAARKGSGPVELGIGDDCAILRPPPGHELLVTTDFSLEGRHFRRDWHSPASIGHRTLARGLSDLAAMGAKPLAAFLSLALPHSVAADPLWLDGFLDGLLGLAATHRVPLAGGDLSEAPGDGVLADIVLLGSAPRGKALRRSRARAGDLLYCTGSLGGAAAELRDLQTTQGRKNLRKGSAENHPHFFPSPRLATGQALLRLGLAGACIDISDGLSTDLAHLCEASKVSAEVDAALLPLHPLANALPDEAGLHAALHGGEDYELLFTVPAGVKVPRSLGGVRLHRIGQILPRSPKRAMRLLMDGQSYPLEPQGWEHLR